VLSVFPTFIYSLVILKSIILFKRGSIANKEVGGGAREAGGSGSGQTRGKAGSLCKWNAPAAGLQAALHVTLTSHSCLIPRPAYPPCLQRFNAWIDKQRAGSPQTGLAVYPEVRRQDSLRIVGCLVSSVDPLCLCSALGTTVFKFSAHLPPCNRATAPRWASRCR